MIGYDHISDASYAIMGEPDYKKSTLKNNALTKDIQQSIINEIKMSWPQCKKAVHLVKGRTQRETCWNIWKAIKNHVKYILDPAGFQYIKTPSRTWKDGFADCKGYSIAASSFLLCAGIPHYVRFVNYDPSDPDAKHVYVVAFPDAGRPYVIDVCMPGPNQEKQPYYHKTDIPMTKIVRLSGIGDNGITTTPVLPPAEDISNVSEGEMNLRIARQRMEIEQKLMIGLKGIGNKKVNGYQAGIEMLDDAIDAMRSDDPTLEVELITEDIKKGVYSRPEVNGIGSKASRKAKQSKRKEFRSKRKEIKKTSTGKDKREQMAELRRTSGNATQRLLQKSADLATKGAKALTKVISAPARLAAKGILELTLPKASPFFLYLFVNDPALIEKLPMKARAKRKKSEKIANFIVDGLGMKRKHFMGLVRNGILKETGRQPEAVLESLIGTKVSGIGFAIPPGVIVKVIEIVKKIVGFFKPKGGEEEAEELEDLSDSDMPAEDDFATMPAVERPKFGMRVRQQKDAAAAFEDESDDIDENGGSAGGKSIWDSLK